jgi:cellulose synthase/poly-beta-1,6-N-acetylglucosamine synthase-like glycosyltransferase
MIVFFYILWLLCILYAIIIISYTYGWFHLKYWHRQTKNNLSTKVSIIISARNEQNNIINCLNDIIEQDYDKELFEIIVIDDASTDNTNALVNDFININSAYNIKLLSLKEQEHQNLFKKRAISKAIDLATGKLIITTDADCRMKQKWLSAIVDFYEANDFKMISAPVCFHNTDTVFKKMQSLEFMSLIVSGAASVALKNPIMCNGANLAYEKELFYKVNGFDNDKYASGDDVFLLLKTKKMFKHSIGFIKNYDATVFTEAQGNLKNFVNQRKRWVSKSRGYNDFLIIIIAFIVYTFNLLLLAGFILCLIYPQFLLQWLYIFLIKIFVDIPVLVGISSFMKQKGILLYYIPVQILNIFYTSVIGILGNMVKYKWKGREIK